MSLSVSFEFNYRNNKKVTIGSFCPQNNRDFNESEKNHLFKMVELHIEPKISKFKPEVRVIKYFDGKKVMDSKEELKYIVNVLRCKDDRIFNIKGYHY